MKTRSPLSKNSCVASSQRPALQSKIALLCAAAGLCVGFSPTAFSQAVTNTTQPRTIEELRRLERERETVLPTPAEVLETPPAKGREIPAASTKTGAKFILREIIFPKSTVFSDEELNAFAAPLVGQEVTMGELQHMTATINHAYAQRGYPINIANIPPQKIKDGILTIQLIESSSGAVRVQNNNGLSEDYVRRHLRIEPGTPIRVDTLEKRLMHFNRTNRAAVTAELKAGEAPATTDILANINEPPRVELLAFSDNAGRENTGLYRGTAMVRGYSWATSGDSATLAGVFSEGTLTAYGSYEVPVDSWGTSVGGSYAYGETNVIKGPFEPLDIDGISHTGDVFVSVPIYTSADFYLRGIVHGTYYYSTTDFAHTLNDEEETYGGTLGLEADLSDSTGRWRFYGEFRGGQANIGAGNAVPDPREGDFYKFNGQISRYQRFNEMFSAVLAVGGQASLTSRLASSEQFQLGGVMTVRGYPEGVSLGDHGYFTRAELWMNLPHAGATNARTLTGNYQGPCYNTGGVWDFICQTVSLFAFVDHGGTFPYKGHETGVADSDFLTSAGVGISFNYRDMITAQFTYAKPLQDVPFGQDEQNFLFRVGCRFAW